MQVDVQGLQAWSAQCATIAGELAAMAAALPRLPGGQATATAVSTGQTLVGGTASLMSGRVRTTGISSSAAATAYTTHEQESAQRLAAVAPGAAGG